MTWRDAVLLAGVGLAAAMDLRTGFVRNWLTAPLLLAGCAEAFLRGGPAALGGSLAAACGAAFLTFAFACGPGGGDVKLALAAGAWLGTERLAPYLLGAWSTRVLLNLLVRLRVRGWSPALAFRDALAELRTWRVALPGERSFRLFQRARERCGGDPDAPGVPGALWVAGGVLAAVLLKGVTG